MDIKIFLKINLSIGIVLVTYLNPFFLSIGRILLRFSQYTAKVFPYHKDFSTS